MQPSGLPAEISGPLFANVALFETHFGLHVKPLLGESQPITLAGRKFDICLRMDSIHMTTTLPYNSFGCTYRYKYATARVSTERWATS